ncbi:hypothetical protein TraAM80_02995 [Trypanosoma rangeli]|uniref:RRM domain-containing protein n=1 Tax=Trypanosoma rangeli TaxID=5698 RepID=A0A422NRI3_TRYRA|nr:uncharacterized protein TraAM80_02995 [Trypanosoma rangeli]RNF08083.1 hypothetical protein TraAM80_02995 [Trypanosoma rangeli]|eukprot:RNF08083.1 hypothetical protein TraAM80_02995 [Trypanosoma rangeli]
MWPKMPGPRTGLSSPSDGGRQGATVSSAASTTLLCAHPNEPSKPCSPQLSPSLGLPPTRTIFIKNVPPTVDNSHKLLPFVPTEGLFSLRVKRTGGRDVGFAEYKTLESAQQAMQWFYRLEATAGIAFNCFSQLRHTWTPTPPRFRYQVPYGEYNLCAGNSARSTELLLNSVILMAEWSLSTPTYRPGFDPFVASSQPSLPPYYHEFAPATTECTPQESFQVSRMGFNSFPGCHSAGSYAYTGMPQRAPRPAVASQGVVARRSERGFMTEGRVVEGGEAAAGCALRSWEPPQGTALIGGHQRELRVGHCQRQRGNESSLAHDTSCLSPGKVFQWGVRDSTIASAVLDDRDLPSSTLFLRVTDNEQRHRLMSAPSSLSLGAPLRGEGEIIDETSEGYEASPCLQYRNRWRQRDQQGLQQRSFSASRWSRLHHRHQTCCVRQNPLGTLLAHQMMGATNFGNAVQPPISDKEEPFCNEFVVDEAPMSPVLLSPITNCKDGDTEDAIARMVLNCNFFLERFAGVRSYVPYSGRAGFLRFERPGDARRCLLWLRRHPDLAPVLNVQFAREDTRRRRSHKRRAR